MLESTGNILQQPQVIRIFHGQGIFGPENDVLNHPEVLSSFDSALANHDTPAFVHPLHSSDSHAVVTPVACLKEVQGFTLL